ncbi:MAG: tetratricopeptide repeat protein [Vicinamibacterales bacterium]|nr:tetratricopeptide repeat protein [Vicinamibacterales bacterium]
MTEESVIDRVERCRRHVEANPASAAAHYNLGLAYTHRGFAERAAESYRAALAIDPDMVEAWVNLGGALLLRWDFPGAADANREALRRKPDLVQAHFNLGQAMLYQGQAQDLLACCERVVELDPDHAAGHYFRGVALLATDKVAEARVAVSRATVLGYRPSAEFLRSLERAEKTTGYTHIHTHPGAVAAGVSTED